jgi:hypothetical protein
VSFASAVQTLLAIFTADILPIFVIAGCGFLIARHSTLDVRTIARVVFNVLAPCMVFSLIVGSTVPIFEFGRMALFAILVTSTAGVVSFLAAKALGLDRPSLIGFVLVVTFSNNGNYGLPVVLFAFGREALTMAAVYFVTSAIMMYTVGVFLAASGRRSVRQALIGVIRVPTIYGVLMAVVVLALGITIPTGIMRPVSLLSDASLPMMMLVLGMQLERATRPERPAAVATAAALSLFVTPLVAIALAFALRLTGPAFQAGVIEASMPAAVVTTIIALEFEVAPSFVTSVVFVSTLLSPFTLTALIAWLQQSG